MCMKLFNSLLVALFTFSGVVAQSEINWMTWEEVASASKVEERKIFVDLYTEWCSWCKKMDAQTLARPDIASYINENYYPIKFDAQHKDDILIDGRTYKYISNGRNSYNELAIELTKGKLSFPTIVFLEADMEVIQPIPGFQGPKNFEKIMTYFAGDFHKTMPWHEYSRTYEGQSVLPASLRGN